MLHDHRDRRHRSRLRRQEQIEKSGGTQQGSGMALAGIILGFVWIGLGFIELGLALT
jgi:hypothetical protein